MLDSLRTTIVVDYQNVHLTGHGLYASTRYLPKHETLVDPLMFANRLILARNHGQKVGYPHAELRRVLVYRGEPSPEHDPDGYARNQAQKSHWERDSIVSVVLRPLKYRYLRDASGNLATDADGRRIVDGPPQEKGVDVLCALALVRESQDSTIDLVVLASSDSDLAPALDEVRRVGQAKVETCCWYDAQTKIGYQLHPSDRTKPLWNTRLHEADFKQSWDPTSY